MYNLHGRSVGQQLYITYSIHLNGRHIVQIDRTLNLISVTICWE